MKSFQGIIHTIKLFHWYLLHLRYNSRLIGHPLSFLRILSDFSIFERSFTVSIRRTLHSVNLPADITDIPGRVLVVKMYLHWDKTILPIVPDRMTYSVVHVIDDSVPRIR